MRTRGLVLDAKDVSYSGVLVKTHNLRKITDSSKHAPPLVRSKAHTLQFDLLFMAILSFCYAFEKKKGDNDSHLVAEQKKRKTNQGMLFRP